MNLSPERHAKINPDAVVAGSETQVRNVIEMMQQDIAELAAALAPWAALVPSSLYAADGTENEPYIIHLATPQDIARGWVFFTGADLALARNVLEGKGIKRT